MIKRILVSTILAWWLLISAAPAFAGEVIDGVIATVNHKPILQSDWEEAICFEAFMQQKPISQVTPSDRLAALQRLIDRHLLAAQMRDAEYMKPTAEELRSDVAKLRAQVPGGSDDQKWKALLAGYGLSEELLKEHLQTESQVMNFVEVRLRPNVHIQADEIEAYYQNQLLPDLQKVGGKIVSLNEAEPKIRELLTQQHMDELLDAWLHNLWQQAEIQSKVPMPATGDEENQARASGVN